MKYLLKIENFKIGEIIERKNKFIVKAKIENRNVFAHLNNTGRLEEFIKKGKVGIFLPIKSKKAKFRLSMIIDNFSDTELPRLTQNLQDDTINSASFQDNSASFQRSSASSSVSSAYSLRSSVFASIIDTSLQMKCFEIALEKGYISWLKGAKILKRNFRINNSFIDYLIEYKNREYFVEVKSAVMKKGVYAMYPDCPSIRGQKHIKELIKHKNSIILFIAGMKNIKAFKPNKEADPKIYELLKIAKQKGVKIKAIQIYFDLKRKVVILKNDNLRVKI